MVRVAFQFGVFAVFLVSFHVAHRSTSLTYVHLSSSHSTVSIISSYTLWQNIQAHSLQEPQTYTQRITHGRVISTLICGDVIRNMVWIWRIVWASVSVHFLTSSKENSFDMALIAWIPTPLLASKVNIDSDAFYVLMTDIFLDIYAQGKNVRKSKTYSAMVHQALNTLTISDPKEHGRRRRVVSQGFSDSSMRNYEPSMIAVIQRFCDSLLQASEEEKAGSLASWKPARNMSQWCKSCLFTEMELRLTRPAL